MKCYKYFWLLILAFVAVSCEEEGPDIQLEPDPFNLSLIDTTYTTDSSYVPQDKKVLIEDYTGVRCSNCPKAAKAIHDIQDTYPGQVVAVGLHVTTQFGTPYNESKEDYRIDAGADLYELLGKKGLPTGNVDRFAFAGEDTSSVMVNYNKWSVYTDQRLQESTPANIYITHEYTPDTRELKINVKVVYTSDVSNNQYLSVALSEDNIIDIQLSTSGKIKDYEHNHVLRQFLTQYNGTLLMDSPEEGRVFEKGYQVTLKENWVAENMNVVAFVHARTSNYTVYHVQENEIVE